MRQNAEFKRRLVAGECLIGAFVKTPDPIVVEVLGASAFDFLVLDAEHAPFDRGDVDRAMMAGRATGCPVLVRIPSADPSAMLGVLDSGAAGVLVPHVTTAEQAETLARAAAYGPGGRGFAGTTRAGSYGARPLVEHLSRSRDEVCLVCQIEDPQGLDAAGAIAAVDGVDALFVGRADLAVSSGRDDFFAKDVAHDCERVLGTAGAATGLYCAPAEELGRWLGAGATFFVVGSDHTLMTTGANEIASRFGAINGTKEQFRAPKE